MLFLVNDCVQFDLFILGRTFDDVKSLLNNLGQTEELVIKLKHALLKFADVHQVLHHVLAKH